jgi:hypothetical protein
MMPSSLPICAAALLFATGLQAQGPAPPMRSWTDAQGRSIQAALKAVEGDQVVLLMASGQTLKFPLAKLSPADQEFAKKGGSAPATPSKEAATPAAKPAPPALPSAPRIPIEKRTWPVIVEVPTKSIEITTVEENPAEKRCVYRSEAFEFVSEDKLAAQGVVKEIARTFEATRALVQALPWGIDPRPPADLGHYQAKFYESRQNYVDAGLPANSGGAYSVDDRIFHIPFQSLGLKMVGKTWAQDREYRNDTIIHEITHQLMHDYIRMLPLWVVEGTAEYTTSLPYNAGKFQAAKHASGLKEYARQRAEFDGMTPSDFRPLDEHMKMSREEWARIAQDPAGQHRAMLKLYFQSFATVYYFCHLDGDGKGTRFLKYLDAMSEARPQWAEYSLKLATYRNAMKEFLKLPGVKKLENNRVSYPSTLTPPTPPEPPGGENGKDFGVEKLDILYDGRTGSQIEAQMKEGFKKIGVKW